MAKTYNFQIIFFFLLLVSTPVVALNSSSDSITGWKAGVARMNITPRGALWMGGYASRTRASEGKLTDLWAKALVLEDANGQKAVLVTMDLIGIPKDISDHIRDRLLKAHNLSRGQVILNASHTHSGPALKGNLTDIYPMDSLQWDNIDQYCGNLENMVVKVVGKAMNSMVPVKLSAGNGVTRFQVNRRGNNEQTLTEQTELKGPNDYAVPVLKVVGKRGKLLAVAFGYACHGTVLNGYQWSGDYMGYAQMALEKAHPGATALFFQGAAGDQNPLPRRSVALAIQYGNELACAVERILSEDIKPLAPVLKTSYSEIDLPLENAPSEEKLLQHSKAFSGFEQRWAIGLLKKYRNGEPIKTAYPYPLEVWKLGKQVIVALGGEPTIGYAIKLKQLVGPDSFILGYSNDVMAYIPTAEIVKEGGYEGESSQIAYGLPSKWNPDIEKKILQEIIKLAGEMGISSSEQLQKRLENIP